jgi:hypothetical protein
MNSRALLNRINYGVSLGSDDIVEYKSSYAKGRCDCGTQQPSATSTYELERNLMRQKRLDDILDNQRI